MTTLSQTVYWLLQACCRSQLTRLTMIISLYHLRSTSVCLSENLGKICSVLWYAFYFWLVELPNDKMSISFSICFNDQTPGYFPAKHWTNHFLKSLIWPHFYVYPYKFYTDTFTKALWCSGSRHLTDSSYRFATVRLCLRARSQGLWIAEAQHSWQIQQVLLINLITDIKSCL